MKNKNQIVIKNLVKYLLEHYYNQEDVKQKVYTYGSKPISK